MTTAAALSLGLVLRDTTAIRADVSGEIGFVRLGDFTDDHITIQTTSVAQLLALADACREAARLLNGEVAA